jgi:hypothetical protein
MALVGSMTNMAMGKLRGRYAFGLPTGCGKTSSIVAWIACLHESGALGNPTSVSVVAVSLKKLATLKRDLIEQGVPEDKISLVHGKKYDATKVEDIKSGTADQRTLDTYASEPSDHDKGERPIALVAHTVASPATSCSTMRA